MEIPTVFHDPEYGAVVRVEMREPSMRNWTLVTPTLSEAVAERVTVEEMVPEGEVRVIVGRVESGVGGGVVAPWYSYAPMSQAPVEGRELPSMSVVKSEERLVPVLISAPSD